MVIDRRTLLRGAAGSVIGVGLPGAAVRRTIYVVGDSTAADYAVTEVPRAGWGQALPLFLNGETVVVVNAAISAASSKSFADVGRLDRVLGLLRQGDVLLISFGHGDQSADPARHTEPWTSYQDYLWLPVEGARAARALPVLVTPVERRRFTPGGVAYRSHGEYPEAMRALAAVTGTPLIDLSELSFALWSSLGPEATKDHFLWPSAGGGGDDTHLQARGAIEVARLLVAAGRMLPGRDHRALADRTLSGDLLVRPPTRPGPDPR
jgi:lysophospholipase L1-like esterase